MSDEAAFIALSEALAGRGLGMLAAMLLAAAEMGIAADSRSFARIFGVEHALVLRELVAMEHEFGEHEVGLITAIRRDERSQRLHFRLTPAAVALIAPAKG